MSDIVNGFTRNARGPTVDPMRGSASDSLPSAVASAKEAVKVLESKAITEEYEARKGYEDTRVNNKIQREQLKDLAKQMNGPDKDA